MFKLLVDHIIEPREKPLFQTGGQRPTKIALDSLFLVDVQGSSDNTFVSMKMGELPSCLNDAQRICEESTHDPRKRRMDEILK